MSEQDASRGFLSRILRGGTAPDLDSVLASSGIERPAEMPRPRGAVTQGPGVQAVPVPNRVVSNESLEQQIEYLHAGLAQVFDLVVALHERESTLDKAFDTLHKELNDYKNAAFYDRLKPIVRPLLFLVDSMEQFQDELGDETKVDCTQVRENVAHFLDQLVDVLHICEAFPLDKPTGPFDPKLQKVVDVVPVSGAGHNEIQRVVRGAWVMNGDLLRPAEVVVGKAK